MRQATPRVLQFCHSYDGPFLDCARQYASLFSGTQYRVTTVYLTGKPSPEVEAGSASDEVVFLGYSSEAVRGLKLSAIRNIRQLVAGRDFRFCIAHRFKPIYISLLGTHLPVIGVHHAFGDYRRLSRRTFVHFFRHRLALLGVSNAVRDDIRAALSSWPEGRIETLYNRIDPTTIAAEQLDRNSARAVLNLPADAWVVGNVGRLHPDKDQATLIRGFAIACRELPTGAILVIMGSGKLESSLKALAEELGINERVRFLGQVPQGRRYFKAFDIFALTSDHEPFGMVLLEAMAAGLPVVCTNCGGGREVVEDIGRLFPLGDAAALAVQLIAAATSDPATLLELQQKMHAKLAGKFSDEAVRPEFWRFVEALEKN